MHNLGGIANTQRRCFTFNIYKKMGVILALTFEYPMGLLLHLPWRAELLSDSGLLFISDFLCINLV